MSRRHVRLVAGLSLATAFALILPRPGYAATRTPRVLPEPEEFTVVFFGDRLMSSTPMAAYDRHDWLPYVAYTGPHGFLIIPVPATGAPH